MKKIHFLIIAFLWFNNITAQNTIRIHCKDGTKVDMAVEDVDSVTFIKGSEESASEGTAKMIGSWLWGNAETGYYELLTFNDDKTYTGYDNYFTYGFDTMTYGWYGQRGSILTLWSNGFGFQRRYNWFITELTDNALAVMTKMGPFTYYKLQPEVIHMSVTEPITCNDDDAWVFADGVAALIEGKQLIAISRAETYILKSIGNAQLIVAYKVVIE